MKNRLMSNWGLKLISVIFAILLWLVVVNVDDPVTTKKFKNIPVDILSENLISDAGETYEVLDKSDQVTITVKAKRSVADSLSGADFKATADIAERISENSIPIKVTATKRTEDIVDIYLQNNTVKIAVEAKEHKEIPVEINLSGKTAEGYTVGSTSIEPGTVQIAGPASIISQVEKVVVPVNINGASEDITLEANGEYYRKDGSIIANSRIEGDISRILINVHLLHTKSIDLNLTTEGEPAAEYWCQDVQYTPTTITIAGEPEELAKINTLEIPAAELNITGASENIVKEIEVEKYLPQGLIICAENEKKIHVTILISALDGREFRIPMSDVDVLNTPAGLDTVLDPSRIVSVIVKGSSEALNSLSINDIKVSVDIKDKEAGTHNLQANVTVPSGYIVMNRPMVSITLERSGEDSSAPPSATQVPLPAQTDVPYPEVPNTPVPQPTEVPPTPTPAVPTSTPIPTPDPTVGPPDEEIQ